MVCDIVVKIKEKKQGGGIGCCSLGRMAREGLTEKATFEELLKRS